MARKNVVNAAVAFAAVVVAVVLAVQAVIGGTSSEAPAELVATGVEGRSAVQIEGTVPTIPAVPTTARTRPPAPVTSTAPLALPPPADVTPPPVTPATPVTPVTSVSQPPAPDPSTMPGPVPYPDPPPATPIVVRTGPGSWTFTDQGVTVTARMTPLAPRVGDTVTISYTASGPGDYCCELFVYVGGEMIDHDPIPTHPCEDPPVTSGSTAIEMTAPGPFTVQVQAIRMETVCRAFPTFFVANLYATFDVLA
ncbi:MAG: hypothetical protein QOE93_131 [Actinomycetota bacterium]|jgi:hypothetical protein|nr:hypothetical protein [Actinomycetota bacterium]